jgi:tetratricopeptide (TPR) repeat protein
LTYRSNGFVTMLAPIRDYLNPQDPQSSPLFCTTKDRYLSRLSIDVDPDKPGFGEARWIVSEDVNVEHLLDVFTSVDRSTSDVWDACYHFMEHLYWHKPRQTLLGSKIEALPDDHRSKPKCLSGLSGLFQQVGNYTEPLRLLRHALELERQQGDDTRVAQTLRRLSLTNRLLPSPNLKEGIRQAKEAFEIFEQIGDTTGQAQCLDELSCLLFSDYQLDAAEDAASRGIKLISEKGQEYLLCDLTQILGIVYRLKGEKAKAIHHFEAALRIASPPNWREILVWTHCDLAELFEDEGEFDDVNTHLEQAKSHAVDDPYQLGRTMYMQACVWYQQLRLEEAKSEVSRAVEILERHGAEDGRWPCRDLLRRIERTMENRSASQGESLEAILRPAHINFYFLASSTPSDIMANAAQAADILFMNTAPFTLFQTHFVTSHLHPFVSCFRDSTRHHWACSSLSLIVLFLLHLKVPDANRHPRRTNPSFLITDFKHSRSRNTSPINHTAY